MDDELKALLTGVKDSLAEIAQKQQELEEANNKIYTDFIDPATEAYNANEKRLRLNAFKGKHGKDLDAYNDQLKALEGDDFDFAAKAFDDYDEIEEKPDEDEYVKALIAKIVPQLEKIKAAMQPKDEQSKDEQPKIEAKIEVEKKEEPKVEEKPAKTEEEQFQDELDAEKARLEKGHTTSY